MNLASKVSIFLLLISVLVYLFINSNIYRMTELDHLQQKIYFGRLHLKMKTSENFQTDNIKITTKKLFNLTYHGKQVFKGQNDNFLTIMKATGKIQSNNDSFYDISDQIKTTCKIQIIQAITRISNNNQVSFLIEGFFLDCQYSKYEILISENQLQDLSIKVRLTQTKNNHHPYQRILLSFYDCKANKYYGLGQQFSYLSLGRDRPYSTFVRQKGVGRTEQPLTFLSNLMHGAGGSYYTSYAPMPIWISNQKFGYIVDQFSYCAWINNKIYVWSNQLEMIIISKQNYKHIIKQISLYNGYTEPVPDWVNQGAILGLQGGTQNVTAKFQILNNSGTKITGVWLQDWVSKRMSLGYSRLWWNWQLDKNHYKGWNQMKQKFDEKNISILLYINPMLTDSSKKEYVRQNYFQIAKQNNYFVKTSNRQNYQTRAVSDFSVSLLNFSNPDAVNFFNQIIAKTLDETGAKGMMVDFAEAYPVENMGYAIQKAVEIHNHYPTLYHLTVNQIIQNLHKNNTKNENDFYIFTRAGYYKSPKYAGSLWAGDQNMNFNFHTGLPSCLTAILSSGLVGYSNTHCDIGGYTQIQNQLISFSQRTQILMIRWMQLSAFTAVFRTHEGNNPQQTLQVYSNQYLSNNFAFYSNVFSILSNYRKKQALGSSKQKIPLLRPLFVELQDIQQVQTIQMISQIQDQFYLGNQIIVAPFLGKQDYRKYFLPKGQWVQIWGGKIYKGCDCMRNWKGYFPPVFIRGTSQHRQEIIAGISELISKYKSFVLIKPLQNKQQL